MSANDLALGAAMAAMVAGAAGTVFVADVPRLVISLGVFLLGVAAAFLVMGSPLLAVSQVFVYVGGVLVLVLFALMLSRRGGGERPRVESRHDIGAAVIALGVFLLLTVVLWPSAIDPEPVVVAPEAIGAALLGESLVAFELVGVLLLAALLAVLVIVKGGADR
ncbi:MAG: NADH-quinone oxidoreductase subunit J [Aeromicrobium sp.]|jgi:NADH-quinone oxidoreductase subunit J|nr:NADH-quinone oxidoreductase subunit J [Aeromicrobium sp.]